MLSSCGILFNERNIPHGIDEGDQAVSERSLAPDRFAGQRYRPENGPGQRQASLVRPAMKSIDNALRADLCAQIIGKVGGIDRLDISNTVHPEF